MSLHQKFRCFFIAGLHGKVEVFQSCMRSDYYIHVARCLAPFGSQKCVGRGLESKTYLRNCPSHKLAGIGPSRPRNPQGCNIWLYLDIELSRNRLGLLVSRDQRHLIPQFQLCAFLGALPRLALFFHLPRDLAQFHERPRSSD